MHYEPAWKHTPPPVLLVRVTPANGPLPIVISALDVPDTGPVPVLPLPGYHVGFMLSNLPVHEQRVTCRRTCREPM